MCSGGSSPPPCTCAVPVQRAGRRRVGDPKAALGDEPLDQLMWLLPPGSRDGPLTVRRPRVGGRCRLTATAIAESSSIIRSPPTRKVSAERQLLDSWAPPPALETRPFDEPVLPYKAERRPSALGVPWDFSGTSGPIKRHEREIAERSFAQVSGHRTPITAGHGARWSPPGHLTGGVSCPLVARGTTPSQIGLHGCPASIPVPARQGLRGSLVERVPRRGLTVMSSPRALGGTPPRPRPRRSKPRPGRECRVAFPSPARRRPVRSPRPEPPAASRR